MVSSLGTGPHPTPPEGRYLQGPERARQFVAELHVDVGSLVPAGDRQGSHSSSPEAPGQSRLGRVASGDTAWRDKRLRGFPGQAAGTSTGLTSHLPEPRRGLT